MIKNKILFVGFLFLFLNSLNLLGQETTASYQSVLNFQLAANMPFQWRVDSKSFLLSTDKTIVKNDKCPLKISYIKKKRDLQKCDSMFLKRAILLSSLKNDSLNITLSYKGNQIHRCLFIVRGLNDLGKVVYIDTMHLSDRNDWTIGKLVFKNQDATTLDFAFKILSTENFSDFNLWLDRIQIAVNGKVWDEYSDRRLGWGVKKEEVLPLSLHNDKEYKQISELSKTKILGLGESVHGSETVSDAVFDVMKHRILYNNCKLVLFECPLDEMLSYNRYVHGDERFELDSIMQNGSLDSSVLSGKIIDFFKWVRKYNETTKGKVSVLGFDVVGDELSYSANLFEYLRKLKSLNFNADDIHKLARIIFSSPDMITDLKKLRKENKIQCDDFELDLIKNYQKNFYQYCISSNALQVRDSLMSQNIASLIKQACSSTETVTIYSHFVHICYDRSQMEGGAFVSPSCGSLLKKQFGRDYFCIGIFVGNGQNRIQKKRVSIDDDMDFISNTLTVPNENCLEFQLKQIKKEYFYVPIGAIQKTQFYIRVGDSLDKDYFAIANPHSSMDGVVYLDKSEPSSIIMPDVSLQKKFERYARKISSFLSIM